MANLCGINAGYISHEVETNEAGCFTLTGPVGTILMLEST